MQELLKKYGLFVAAICAVLVVCFSFSNIVTQPWRCVTDLGGDGMKNMFNYVYESCYGTGLWYDGMNYPYGEHIVYTDGLPLFSVLFVHIGNITPDAAMTILWWAIALSWALAIIYVYRTLVHFSVMPLLAIVFSCLITMMSPQVIRLMGHYSLSFTCVIPMLFYWSVRYHEGKELRYALFIAILGIVACLVHPYFSAMVLLWVAAYVTGYFLLVKVEVKQKIRKTTPILLSGLAVAAFFKGFLALTDPIKDRAVQPFGFLEYKTRIKELVSSDYTWFWHLITRNHLVKLTPYYGEGTAYLGLAVVIIVLTATGCLLFSVWVKKKSTKEALPAGFHPIWLFVGASILLFSMGVPFVFHMQWLADYLTFLRQFRSLGRFDWIFYFITTVYAALAVNKWFLNLRKKSRHATAFCLLFVSLGLWASECADYVNLIRSVAEKGKKNYDATFSPTSPNWEKWLALRHFKSSDFQAVLSWGIVNIGSEKYWVGEKGMWGLTLSEIAALRLHLPVIDANLSRSSWDISRKQTKLASGPFAEKDVLNDLKNTKPILLIQFQNDTLEPDETYVLNASDYIGDISYCHIYALYPTRLMENDRIMKDSVMRIAHVMTGTDTCIGSSANLYIDHFDKYPCKYSQYGSGAQPKNDDSVLVEIPIRECDTQSYEFSAWFRVDSTNWASPVLLLYFFDGSGRQIAIRKILTYTCFEHDGLWSRANGYFKLPPHSARIICGLLKQPVTDYILKDEVQFRPQNSLFISRLSDGKIMANNHWLKS